MEEQDVGLPGTFPATGAATPQERAPGHTPGPWYFGGRAAHNGEYAQYDIGLGVWGDGGDLAGQVHGCRGEEYMQVGGVCSEADARLIAAAPELLNTLRALLVAVTYSAPPVNFGGTEDDPNFCWSARIPVQFVDEARAAVAKAEGRA